MKRTIFTMAVLASASLVSCGGVDGEKAAEELCACTEKSGDEKTECLEAWGEEYGDASLTSEEEEKMTKKIMDCGAVLDPDVGKMLEKHSE